MLAARGRGPKTSKTARRCAAIKSDSPVMAAESSENEVLAQELESLGERVHAIEKRLADVQRVIEGLEAAAQTTARALEEVSSHWDSVYRAMRRAE
jgi:hypothetical protein